MVSSSGSGGGEGTSDAASPPSATNKITDGWDNEEWGSLEEEAVWCLTCDRIFFNRFFFF